MNEYGYDISSKEINKPTDRIEQISIINKKALRAVVGIIGTSSIFLTYMGGIVLSELKYNYKPNQTHSELTYQREKLEADSTFYSKTMPYATLENQKAFQDSLKINSAKKDSIDFLIAEIETQIQENSKKAINWGNPFYNK